MFIGGTLTDIVAVGVFPYLCWCSVIALAGLGLGACCYGERLGCCSAALFQRRVPAYEGRRRGEAGSGITERGKRRKL